jgi:glycosyltransferase involved in cell wall biosynthesis
MQLTRKKGYSKKDIIILVPRRLVPKNGVEYAIDAIKSISNGNVKLLIAGDGPLLAKLESKSDRDERIQFLGAISYNEIDEYYKLSDIILIPSITSNNIQEATSISMLEGMACEKYVICSNIVE